MSYSNIRRTLFGVALVLSVVSVISLSFLPEKVEAAAKKWFPGHYIQAQDQYGANDSAISFLKTADAAPLQGLFMYSSWGMIETTKGTYRWDKIDTVLNNLPAGKKLALSLSWTKWGGGNESVPADMIGNSVYDGGIHPKSTGVNLGTIYMTSTMDRYLAFVKAFADRYDNDPRIAFITTAEIAFDTAAKGPQYKATTAHANMVRMANAFATYFPHTVSGSLGAWWSFGGSSTDYVNATYNTGGGFGFPDLIAPGAEHYNSSFRQTVISKAGQWASWMGMEWADLIAPRGSEPWPDAQLNSAKQTKTNFIWWNLGNRISAGGHDFKTQALPQIKKDPYYGITTACPTNITCDTSGTGPITPPSPPPPPVTKPSLPRWWWK
jgi:hypothetical protein